MYKLYNKARKKQGFFSLFLHFLYFLHKKIVFLPQIHCANLFYFHVYLQEYTL